MSGETDVPGDAQTPPALARTIRPTGGTNVFDATDSRNEVQVRLVAVQGLLSAALDGTMDSRLAIDGSLRLLAHAEDFLPGAAH